MSQATKRVNRATTSGDRQQELPALGIAEQYASALRFQGFQTHVERVDDLWVIDLVRGNAMYQLQVTSADAEVVSIATVHNIATPWHDPLLVMTLASAIMGQLNFVRVRFEPTQRFIVVSVDAVIPSAGFLARHIARWIVHIDAASSMLFEGLERFAEPPAQSVPRTRRPASSSKICRLKVTLRGAKPPIWRRIEVPCSATLAKLHRMLQVAMGWHDSHLHCFEIGKVTYGIPDRDFNDDMLSEKSIRLGDLVEEKMRFSYVYDFGDNWTHDLVVEDIFDPRGGVKYPQLVGGARAAPPEDVGGIYGYREFVEAISEPRHREHESMLKWAGGSFDPEFFDAEETRRTLKRLR